MPRGEEHEPRLNDEDVLRSLRAMRNLCDYEPDCPPEPITTEDDAFARQNWHIKVTP